MIIDAKRKNVNWLSGIDAEYRNVIKSDFVRKVGETFATRVFLIGIGLVTSVLVARILGPEGRGLYAVAVAVGAIGVQFGNFGLHASNTYYVAKDKKLLPELIGNTLSASFLFGGLGALLAWVVFFIWPNLAPVHGVLLVLALAWIPFGLAYLLLQNLLLGIHEVRAYNKIELINQIVGVILIGLVILAGIVRAEIVFSSGLAALLAGFFLALRALRQHLKEFPMPSMSLFKKNIRYGIRAYLAAFFAFLVLRIDLLMIKYILGAEQAGYYSIAVSMADMINMLPVVVGTILFPKLSALINNDAKWNIAKKTALGVGIMMIILTSCAALLAKPAITILFGKSFMPAVPAFIWLMPGIVFLSINIIYMNYFASTGMPSITIYSPAIAALCNILLNLKLIPLLGIVGASFSSVFSYGIMLGGSVLYISYGKRK